MLDFTNLIQEALAAKVTIQPEFKYVVRLGNVFHDPVDISVIVSSGDYSRHFSIAQGEEMVESVRHGDELQQAVEDELGLAPPEQQQIETPNLRHQKAFTWQYDENGFVYREGLWQLGNQEHRVREYATLKPDDFDGGKYEDSLSYMLYSAFRDGQIPLDFTEIFSRAKATYQGVAEQLVNQILAAKRSASGTSASVVDKDTLVEGNVFILACKQHYLGDVTKSGSYNLRRAQYKREAETLISKFLEEHLKSLKDAGFTGDISID